MESRNDTAIYIFRQILHNPTNVTILVAVLVYFLWQVVRLILFASVKMYSLLSVALGSPASRVGAGLGGIIGLVIGVCLYGSWITVVFGLGAGALLGGVSINGIYCMALGHHTQQAIRQKQEKGKKKLPGSSQKTSRQRN